MKTLSKLFTNYLLKKQVIESDDIESYQYSFEILLSTIINFIFIIVITIIFKEYIAGLVFTICFIILRRTFGGYHAKTHLGCFLILTSIFLLLMLLIKFINNDILSFVGVIMLVPSVIIYYIVGVVEHPNNLLNKEYKKKIEIIGYLLVLGLSFVATLFYCLDINSSICFTISYTLFVISITQVIGKIAYKNLY